MEGQRSFSHRSSESAGRREKHEQERRKNEERKKKKKKNGIVLWEKRGIKKNEITVMTGGMEGS